MDAVGIILRVGQKQFLLRFADVILAHYRDDEGQTRFN